MRQEKALSKKKINKKMKKSL